MKINLSNEERSNLYQYLNQLRTFFSDWLFAPSQAALGDIVPDEIATTNELLNAICHELGSGGQIEVGLKDEAVGLLRLAVQFQRRCIAERQEDLRSKTHGKSTSNQIDGLMNPIDRFMQSEWYSCGQSAVLPPITEFLTVKMAYQTLSQKLKPVERQFDDKFGVLQSQKTFLEVLRNARTEAKLRNSVISVVFTDLDNFKSLNTRFSEVRVDREILPTILQTIESHCFHHGNAFQFGGDEFVLLFPNLEPPFIHLYLIDLRRKLNELVFFDPDIKISISMGVCTVPGDSIWTDQEILTFANAANRKAKTHAAKNQIVACGWEQIREAEMCFSLI